MNNWVLYYCNWVMWSSGIWRECKQQFVWIMRRINNIFVLVSLFPCRLEWHKTIREGLKEYCALIDSSSSFRAYRLALAETNPPCIPYMSVKYFYWFEKFKWLIIIPFPVDWCFRIWRLFTLEIRTIWRRMWSTSRNGGSSTILSWTWSGSDRGKFCLQRFIK